MPRWTRWPVQAAAAIGLLWIVTTVTPLAHWWATALAGRWEEPAGPTLVVLAGSELEGDILGGSTYWRCVYALMAYRRGGVQRIYLSGGSTENRPVAELMRMFLEGQGIPPQVLRTDTLSLTTHESAVNLAPLLQKEPATPTLLTSDFHMYRAWRAFRKQGVILRPSPIPDVRKRATRWQRRWDAFLDLATETTKIHYYRWKGWI
jgi:uncharacterized SAM-binding protein YcdF (DUF218 family)